MAYKVAFIWSKKCEEELKRMGFKKTEVYLKHVSIPGNCEEVGEKGDREFFQMDNPPLQFKTTSYWGAGPSC